MAIAHRWRTNGLLVEVGKARYRWGEGWDASVLVDGTLVGLMQCYGTRQSAVSDACIFALNYVRGMGGSDGDAG